MIGSFTQAAAIVIALDVVFTADDPWSSLVGVTLEARARIISPEGVAVLGTVTVAGARVTVQFAPRALGVGIALLEVLGTKDGLTLELLPRFSRFEVRKAVKP